METKRDSVDGDDDGGGEREEGTRSVLGFDVPERTTRRGLLSGAATIGSIATVPGGVRARRLETWGDADDWDDATSSSGVVHEAVAHTDHVDDDDLKQGYSAETPYDGADTAGYWPLHEDVPTGERWVRADANPVITDRNDCDWILDDGTYYLYTTRDSARAIEVWTSSDGTSWTRDDESPVLEVGSQGSWDDADVRDPSIVETDGTYYLYYSGSQQKGQGANEIGVATAPTPTGPFEKPDSNPILSESPSGWDSAFLTEPHVRVHEGVFEMTYTGTAGINEAIGHASSTDGISFDKDDDNPVYDPGDVNDQCHLYANGEWNLYYTNKDTLNIEKVVSETLSSFSEPGAEVVASDESDYSPAIRYDPDAAEYKMYWHWRNGARDEDDIYLATTTDVTFGNVHDVSGNGRPGTATDVTFNAGGLLGTSAFEFDGSRSVVKIPHADAVDSGAGPVTVSAWIRRARSGVREVVVAKNQGSAPNLFLEIRSDDHLRFQIGDQTDNAEAVSRSTVTTDDGWTFVQGVATGAGSGDLVVYVDGVEDARTERATWNSSTNREPFCIGAVERSPDSGDRGTVRQFDGKICDVRLVDAAWTADDVRTLHDVVATEGTLTTDWRTATGAARRLDTVASVPATTTLELTVEQDVGGDGTADNARTVAVADGMDSATLSGFSDQQGRYRLVIAADNDDGTATAELDGVDLTVSNTTPTASATDTPTRTATPSSTASPSPTASPSASPSPTASPSASASPTASPTTPPSPTTGRVATPASDGSDDGCEDGRRLLDAARSGRVSEAVACAGTTTGAALTAAVLFVAAGVAGVLRGESTSRPGLVLIAVGGAILSLLSGGLVRLVGVGVLLVGIGGLFRARQREPRS